MTQPAIAIIDQIRFFLDANDKRGLTALIDNLKSNELIHAIGHLPKQEQASLLTLLAPEDAADVIEEIPDAQAVEIIEDIDAAQAAAILDKMTSDEQADLIQEMHFEDAEAILDQLSDEDANEIRRLVMYDPKTAGGIMVTEILVFDEQLTVGQVIEHLRVAVRSDDDTLLRYIYITDSKGIISGVIQMWDLVPATPDTRLINIAQRAVLTVNVDTQLDELINFFDTYDFYAVPVIDHDGRICGAVLRKDLLEAETENMVYEHLETQGIVGGDEIRTMPVLLRSRRRLSWLSVNILLNIVAASVIAYHQDVLESVIALAVFLPIISDMSGCSGNQAVAVSMRELSLGVVKPTEAMRVWIQEVSVGIINGLILGLLIALAAFFWKGNIFLGIVAGGALMLNTILAVSIGGTVPLLLKRFGVDPALASGPILTTITDMCGFFLALTFASMLLPQLGGL
ncbi:MAG: magnesium transporter [Saprospiraceae bacterium]|nr:magnesium transporter [Saprospiraceae bacterium]